MDFPGLIYRAFKGTAWSLDICESAKRTLEFGRLANINIVSSLHLSAPEGPKEISLGQASAQPQV